MRRALNDRTVTAHSGGSTHHRSGGTTLLALALLVAGPASGQLQQDPGGHPLATRNFDARIDETAALRLSPDELQADAIEALRVGVPELLVTVEPTTGATRTLSSAVGYLTPPQAVGTPKAIALDFVRSHPELLGLTAQDLENLELTDEVISSVSGVSHLYWRQTHQGIPVYNGQVHVNIDKHGRILSINNLALPGLASAVAEARPALSAAQAVISAAEHLGIAVRSVPESLSAPAGPRQTTLVSGRGVSLEDIRAELFWLPIQRGEARLVWNLQVQTLDQTHWFDFTVDAVSGKVWTRFDWTADSSYTVYAQPVESPQHTSPLPPSDARTQVADPHLAAPNASPNGWHNNGSTNFTNPQGNNAHAYEDRDGNNVAPALGSQPNGGAGLNFNFPINLSANPSQSIPAAVTNLFYWNNIIHDVQYQYGFNEAAGNFQSNNFGRGGAGNDWVRAEAQDNALGGSNCNANFSTPPDGSLPRMQMFLCNMANPPRDGDFDNGVIVHEYGHGISIRQVGGPGNSGCLSNAQQGGEGWSDWHALVYTAKASDTGPQARGVGSYLFGLAPDGTIRGQRYSTSSAINNWTYSSIAGMSIPHGVGSVWAQAIWEVYWRLVDEYGFSSNLYNATGGAGNQRALLYINEGFKNTACSPTFIAARDGIIAAAQSINPEDVCLLWEAFAGFGLGTNASTPGSNSTSATNGFNLPASCTDPPPPPPECPADSINFNGFGLESYADQNVSNQSAVLDGGSTLQLTGNTWLRSTQSFNLAADTTIEFQFASGNQGEIHAIGFDTDQTLNNQARHFQFFGTQNWTGGGRVTNFNQTYTGNGAFQTFSIPVGQFYTGSGFRLVFTNDKDSGTLNNEGRFRCVRVIQGGGGGGCVVDDDFEGGAAGWINSPLSTCTTGAYVLGTPTLVTNGGVTTQPAGDHTTGSGNAIFTATNTSAGVNDVDGGNCILESPTFPVTDASTLSLWWFHGQRDQGGDPNGDFFRVEVSTNDGLSYSPIASTVRGDVTSNAAWTNATASIPAGSQVKIRVHASDGTATGDLVEGGIDDLSICSN
jgi:extracellular elastinolytic metalloproteinase